MFWKILMVMSLALVTFGCGSRDTGLDWKTGAALVIMGLFSIGVMYMARAKPEDRDEKEKK